MNTARLTSAITFSFQVDVHPSAPSVDRKRSLLGILPSMLPSSMTPRGLFSARRRGSAGSSAGPSLRDWQVAIAKEVPDEELSLDEAEEELRKLRLAPILLPYELRCFWWYDDRGSNAGPSLTARPHPAA